MFAVNRVNRMSSTDGSRNPVGRLVESWDETEFIVACRGLCEFFSDVNMMASGNVVDEVSRERALGGEERCDYKGFQWDETVLRIVETQVTGRDAVVSKCEVVKAFLRCFEKSDDPLVRILIALSEELEKVNNSSRD